MTFTKRFIFAASLVAFLKLGVAADAPHLSTARTNAEARLVDIRSRVPDIAEDIKYASHDNFVGRPVNGYFASKCLLLAPAADALAQVERAVRKQGYRLLLWDCYRPTRAVADFVQWAHNIQDTSTKALHYPHLHKSQLLGTYIAPVSGHSRGATVDLTLMRCTHKKHCTPLDMGTGFDYFGLRAHTQATGLSKLQRANRARLLKAMARGGFSNYPQEWWHYTLQPEPTPNTQYNVPVQ